MSINAWTSIPGRQAVQILTVDPALRRVEGRLRDGTVIQIAIDTNAFFRWPKQDEWWYVHYTNRGPVLDTYVQNVDSSGAVEDIKPGDALVDADQLVLTGSLRLAPVTMDTRPDPEDAGAGAIIFVADATAGNRFQGSTGTIWISLG